MSEPPREYPGWYTVIFERQSKAAANFNLQASDEADARAQAEEFFRDAPELDPRRSEPDITIRVVKIATGSLMTGAARRDPTTEASGGGQSGEGGGEEAAGVAADGAEVTEPPRIVAGFHTIIFERDGEIYSTWTLPARDEAAAIARFEARCRAQPELDPRRGAPDLTMRVVKTTIPESYD